MQELKQYDPGIGILLTIFAYVGFHWKTFSDLSATLLFGS